MFQYHIPALVIGFLLDCILGDPYRMPHPIRLIGKTIKGLETLLRGNKNLENRQLYAKGIILVIAVTNLFAAGSFLLLFTLYRSKWWLGLIVESIMCYQLLAAKSLKTESTKVLHALNDEDVNAARTAVSMIVGRDTEGLDESGIIKASVETVAENTSDGVIAPMLYMALGGAAAGFFYKSVNTMDSMIGYKNEKYFYFGKFAAKLDDVCNYIPARLSALFMICAAFISGYHASDAFRIWRRDGRKHASPNSAQTEAAMAGALGIQLAGDAYYFGQLCPKDIIGDLNRSVERMDIKRANSLMYRTAWISLAVILIVYMAGKAGGFFR